MNRVSKDDSRDASLDGGARDPLSEPLLGEAGDEEDDSDTSTVDSPHSSSNRAAPGKEGKLNGPQQQPSANLGGGVVPPRIALPPSLRWTNPPPLRRLVPSYTGSQRGDYRSEGEQPFTERNGNRRPLGDALRHDWFRTNRMPKRGGRKRLRRNLGRAAAARRPRIKIRVSSYCVAHALKTLDLLRWLESLPNRQLSIGYLAQGAAAAAPRGPVGASSWADVPPGTSPTLAGAKDFRGSGTVDGVGSVNLDVEAAGALCGEAETAAASPGVDGLEWMDSLYIDVIHSTTDLRGLRKARELERPGWEEEDSGDGEDGDDYGSGYGGGDGAEQGGVGEGEGEGDDAVTRHKDVMFFPYGAVVFWGCSEAEEKELLANLTRFMVGKVSDTELAHSSDDMTFVYRRRGGKRGVPLKNDEITLDTRDPAEKLAYSCALAQSAKLFVFEGRLDNIVETTALYPKMLAATGKIPLTEIQIGRLVGRVLCEQNEVNLHSDILDTPEYFWEEDTWEPAYEALCVYLDIPLRVDNLNKRLSILRELLDVLSTQSTNAHATRLEVIIIYLIFVEVAIELVWNVIIKDLLRLY